MKANEFVNEDNSDSGAYQQMLAFTQANRVGGVPDDQQIPLALFKELKKQQQQNQALGAELDAAEQRIDQATQSGELSQRELGMHRGELDRERAAGEKQQAAVGQLGQQYAEREKASGEQIKQLTNQLEMVKNMPGVDAKAAKELEKQIQELGKKSVSLDKLAELESSIAAVQNMQSVDDAEIQDLMAQIEQAQKDSKELEKTKASVGKDAEETAQRALDQIEQIKQELEQFQNIENETTLLTQRVNNIAQTTSKLAQAAYSGDAQNMAKGQIAKQAAAMLPQSEPSPQMSLPGVTTTPPPAAGSQLELPGVDQAQAEPERYKNIAGQFKQANPVNKAAVYETQLQNAIKWATGRNK